MSDFNSDKYNDSEIDNEIQKAEQMPSVEENITPSDVLCQSKSRKFLADIVDYIEIIVFAIAFVILIFSFFFRISIVSGSSMEDTLHANESLIVSDFFYTPKRNDIIVFHQTGERLNEPIVKRIIAVEGETVEINHLTWEVKVTDKNGNTVTLDEDYIKLVGLPLPYSEPIETFEVKEGTVFVMGDNRNVSNDSRGAEIGLVDTRCILGKVILRISPLDKFGMVE